MRDFFEEAFAFMLVVETDQYTDDPRDSGGPTKYGITWHAYCAFVGQTVNPEIIKNLNKDQAKDFYLEKYWSALKCEEITQRSIAVCLFDSGVLFGIGTVSIIAQGTLNRCGMQTYTDGIIGERTLVGLNTVKEELFIPAFRDSLIRRIDSVIKFHPKNEVYRAGWTNRANRLLTLIGADPLIKEDPNSSQS